MPSCRGFDWLKSHYTFLKLFYWETFVWWREKKSQNILSSIWPGGFLRFHEMNEITTVSAWVVHLGQFNLKFKFGQSPRTNWREYILELFCLRKLFMISAVELWKLAASFISNHRDVTYVTTSHSKLARSLDRRLRALQSALPSAGPCLSSFAQLINCYIHLITLELIFHLTSPCKSQGYTGIRKKDIGPILFFQTQPSD
jgi:hypothetical protein